MMKPLVYILVIFVTNVALSFASLAFMLFLFRQDLILAAVPAILAAPAIILQPWFVVSLFLPGGLLLAPFLTTILTVLIYGSLNRLGMLERPKFIASKFKSRKVLAVVGSFVLLAVLLAFARYKDFPSLNQGIPPNVGVAGLTVTDSRYYRLSSFIDSQWLWRARINESNLAGFAYKYDLSSIAGNQVPAAFLRMPPYWWRPKITNRTKVLSTPDFPIGERGPDGWHAMAVWNPEGEVLYVWIKDNF